MPQASNKETSERVDHWWSTAKHGIASDPLRHMAAAGLFQIGLPGAGAELDTYRAIAVAEQAIAARTGSLGLATGFAARQLTARFFIAGFANAEQRASWLPRIAAGNVCAAIAISEPGVGAHPKHLKTVAEAHGAGFIIRGQKAWITNGGIADLFLVLAIIAIEDGRKRYGLFIVPKETARLSVKPMRTLDALAPATHCELALDGCELPATARLGDVPDAYATMALPFRDLEDTVGTGSLSGLLCWLLQNAATHILPNEENALRLGRIAGLIALVHATSQLAAASLDGEGENDPGRVIGIRLLATDIVSEIRGMLAHSSNSDEIGRAFAAFDLLASVAREPRKLRQVRLGNSLWSLKNR